MNKFLSRLKSTDAGLIIAGLLSLFIIRPLLQPGLPTTADMAIHLYRALEYERVWASGVILPHWGPNLAFGYGYPLFVFAPPLPYWLAVSLHAGGLSLETAFKALIILIILVYAIGMYLLARDLFNRVEAGLVAAVAYTFAPFALRELLLVGGNVPQYLAIGLFPWILWAMTRAVRVRSWGWTITGGILYGLLILSHLFHTMIFTPVALLFGLVQQTIAQPPPRRLRDILLQPATLTLPLGVLLTTFFWLPAFVERANTSAQADVYLQKSPFFIRYPHWSELTTWVQPLDARAANPYVPLTLGIVTLTLAGLGLVAAGWLWWQAKNRDPLRPQKNCDDQPPLRLLLSMVFFFGAVAAAAIFLSLSPSRPIWETITILQVAQFPWRLLGLANLGLATLAGAGMTLYQQHRDRFSLIWLLLLLFSVWPLLYPVIPFTRFGTPTLANQVDFERRSQTIGATTLGEYLPRAVTNPPTGSPLVEPMLNGQQPERLDRDSLPAGAVATLLEQTAATHRYQFDLPTAATLRFWQFDYPGWQATLDGEAIEITPETDTGLILVDVPTGSHTLTLHFGLTPLRLAALIISGLTVIGLIAFQIAHYSPRSEAERDRTSRIVIHHSSFVIPNLHLPPGVLLTIAAAIIAMTIWGYPRLRPMFTRESPPGLALPAQHYTQITFANGIQLIGYGVSEPVVEPGGYLQVTLYWQTLVAPLEVNLQPFVHLDRLNDLTTAAGSTNYTPGDTTTESVLPTFHWDTNRYVRDEHDLFLPADLPPHAYAVRIGLLDPASDRLLPLADAPGDTAALGVINVAPAAEPPPPDNALDIRFMLDGDTIRLTGFDTPVVGPERLTFRLLWQSPHQPATEYSIFAQLLDSGQNLVASFDGPPLNGAYPTSTWLPEQPIPDPRQIPLEGVPPGEYRLIVGLYGPASGQRMTTLTGADFADLGLITIPAE